MSENQRPLRSHLETARDALKAAWQLIPACDRDKGGSEHHIANKIAAAHSETVEAIYQLDHAADEHRARV